MGGYYMQNYVTKGEYYNSIESIGQENPRIKNALDEYNSNRISLESDDKLMNSFLANADLSPEEYIHFIAILRSRGDGQGAGGAVDAALEFIVEDYRNTPWKFVEEFLQNADDCTYDDVPEIEITVDGSKSSIEFAYNEKGFSAQDIWSLTQFRNSNKPDRERKVYGIPESAEGLFFNEKTGRKGIGFKSVFALPTDNVIVHIRSNGYSFMLNKRINTIVPVWEDGFIEDGKTHVTVELEIGSQFESSFNWEDIYPHLREQFCVDKIETLFQSSPILFMHRLKKIRVNNIKNGKTEYFETGIVEKTDSMIYGDSLPSSDKVLSAVCQKGIMKKFQWGNIAIQMKDNTGLDKNIMAVRYSESRCIGEFWRAFSVISPVLIDDSEYWNGGSLFRTFPVEHHKYDVPFAMDIPFELDSSRMGVSYDVNQKDFNNHIYNAAFDTKEGVFAQFVLRLRDVSEVRIDKYFCGHEVMLFNDASNNSNNECVIPYVDLEEILEILPVFPVFGDNEGFVSFNNLICIDEVLLEWPEVEKLADCLLGENKKNLVAKSYMSSAFLEEKRNSVFGSKFNDAMNAYIDYLEDRIGINSTEFVKFLECNLYPYIAKNRGSAIRIGAHRNIKMFVLTLNLNGTDTLARSAYNSADKWISGVNKYSINNYRTIYSSRANLDALLPVIEEDFSICQASYEFSKEKIETVVSGMNSWEEVCTYLESIFYYGFLLEDIHIGLLDKYAITEEIDSDYNPFRDAGIVKVISKSDIQALSSVSGKSVADIVGVLKKAGLRDGEDYFVASGGFLVLKEITNNLLKVLEGEALDKCLSRVKANVISKGKKLDIAYSNIISSDLRLSIFFLINKELVAQESYLQICADVLTDENIWKKGNDESAEMLLRAIYGARTQDFPTQYRIKIGLEYLLNHSLPSIYTKAVENRGFDKVITIDNRGFFTQLDTDDVFNLIGMFAEQKLEEQKGIKFFAGNLHLGADKKQNYLIDNISKIVYFNLDEEGDYKESLIKYLKSPYDPEKGRYIDEFRRSTKKVYEEIIAPVLPGVEHDYDRAFDEIEGYFPSYSKQEIINIIAWFRYKSYAKALGGATSSHEKEIEDDYREEPWRFVYEFLQNVDDCTFAAGVCPELAIHINEKDNNIVFEYNENGFEIDDIKSLTAFGSSEKSNSLEKNTIVEGIFDLEKTGRKGRGFKSVFALPGKDIVVHISSNGYSFKFVKCFGEIIPVWENLGNEVTNGTRIIVEGFQGSSIRSIYKNMLTVMCAGEREELFSKSPLLFLRKLKKIAINSGNSQYVLRMDEKNVRFSDQHFNLGNLRLVSGIRKEGTLRKSYVSDLSISISMTGEPNLDINAVRFCAMEDVIGEARLVSIIAPIIKVNDNQLYTKGALYRTLPLNENTYGIPLAINAPYDVNSGRSAIKDESNKVNTRTTNVVVGEVIPALYNYLRNIEGIAIENYIFEKDSENGKLFGNLSYVPVVDLEDITRSLPILKLYSQNGFVSCNDARMLVHECYKWYKPEELAKIFTNNHEDLLVEEKYTSRRIGANRINYISTEFHLQINTYIGLVAVEQAEELWSILQNQIIPFIGACFDRLSSAYRNNSEVEKLQEMRIFPYTTYSGEYKLEGASDKVVWLSECPEQFNSFGIFRVLDSAPITYTDDMKEWMRYLITIRSYKDAFKEENLKLDSVKSWDDLKKWIEIFIYYRIAPSFKIGYLAKCALSKVLSPIKNLFRDAFVESNDSEVLDFCIDEVNIKEILSDMDGYGDASQEQIIAMLRQLGLKPEDDYFDIDHNIAHFKKETLAMFKHYCKDCDSASECVSSVKDAYNKLYKQRAVSSMQLRYEEVKHCKPVFISQIIRQELMRNGTSYFAEEVYSDASSLIKNADFVEMVLMALAYLNRENDAKHNLQINLSEIISRKIGSYVKQGMSLRRGVNFGLQITRDVASDSYESKEVKKSLSWLQDSDSDDISDIEKYEYYTAEIKNAFNEDENGLFIFDSSSVILDVEETSSNLLEFVRVKYASNADGELFSGLIKIVSIQNELTGGWARSKQEYIERLAEFREETQKYINFLCPDYQKNINQATGKTEEYLIPELLQNINDCRTGIEGRDRELKIIMEDKAMILQYMEAGFDYSDVYSITAYGQSTKHDEREGEKGLGFKKVFAVFPMVEIYSNGFSFSLTKEKATVPKWIDDVEKQRKYQKTGYTTMVFNAGTMQIHSLSKIKQIWNQAIRNSSEAGLLLALQNIRKYTYITSEGELSLTRESMLDKFYQAEVPLLALYQKLISQAYPQAIANDKIHALKAELKKRKKCAVMNEDEYNHYISNLPISVYIPKEKQPNNRGKIYSTLPTSKDVGANIFINLPLELSTGRNEVLEGSAFNQAVWRVVFGSEDISVYSAVNFIFCNLMARCPDLDIYKYFNGNVDDYISMISQGNETDAAVKRKQLDILPLFRSFPDGQPVALSGAYTADRIIYEYVYSEIEPIKPFDDWVSSKPGNEKLCLLSLRNGDLEQILELNSIASSIGEDKSRFPMMRGDRYMPLTYFESEYGTNEEDE